ncbi:hypothetical protein XENTR_v10019007 [Xenopus tropicalis]|nr:hypothetical protein XENTR_v10019007 [Xenopus tropicalis]
MRKARGSLSCMNPRLVQFSANRSAGRGYQTIFKKTQKGRPHRSISVHFASLRCKGLFCASCPSAHFSALQP